MPEVGKTSLKQTSEFKLAVKTCLIKGQNQLAIALAIHETSITKGHYPGESIGKGLNYDKIQATVSKCKKTLNNQK